MSGQFASCRSESRTGPERDSCYVSAGHLAGLPLLHIRETEAKSWLAGTTKVSGRLNLFFASLSISQRPHFSDNSTISANVNVRSKSRSEIASTEHSHRTEFDSLLAGTSWYS